MDFQLNFAFWVLRLGVGVDVAKVCAASVATQEAAVSFMVGGFWGIGRRNPGAWSKSGEAWLQDMLFVMIRDMGSGCMDCPEELQPNEGVRDNCILRLRLQNHLGPAG